jgi:(1->4)-alpha-D-glucan 1-alpha-D-glucosylmutase
VESIAWPGAVNGVALALMILAGPGVPDTYQGSEGWALTLVDPDNRRAVDAAALEQRLDAAIAATPDELLREWRDGRLKALVVHRVLEARRRDPELFTAGAYHALDAGPHALAFARELDGRWAIAAVPRSPATHPPSPTVLAPPDGAPAGPWTDVLAGATADAPTAFAPLPVSLLAASAAR